MYTSDIEIRVRYGETDQMGFVYYGNYAQYFEVARVEALRKLGLSYKQFEENGILMPVLDFKCKFIRSAYYDDILSIKTIIREMPQVRIKFEYEVYNQQKALVCTGETTLVFIYKSNNKPCRTPIELVEKLKPFNI